MGLADKVLAIQTYRPCCSDHRKLLLKFGSQCTLLNIQSTLQMETVVLPYPVPVIIQEALEQAQEQIEDLQEHIQGLNAAAKAALLPEKDFKRKLEKAAAKVAERSQLELDLFKVHLPVSHQCLPVS